MIWTSLELARSPFGWALIGFLVLVMLASSFLGGNEDSHKVSSSRQRDLFSIRTFVLQLATLEVAWSLIQGFDIHGHGVAGRLMFAHWYLGNGVVLVVFAFLTALIDMFSRRFRADASAWISIVDALFIILGVFGCAYVIVIYEFADHIRW